MVKVLLIDGLRNCDSSATSKIDEVLIKHGGPHVPPPTFHLSFFLGEQVEGTILRRSYSLSLSVGHLLHVKS